MRVLWSFVVVLIVCVAWNEVVRAQSTGARGVVSQNLLNTAISGELPTILAKFNGYTLPDLSGENSEGPLNIHWTLTGATIVSPTVGPVATAFTSPNVFEVVATGIGITIEAQWSYYFWTGWKNSDHGSVTLSFSSVSVGIEVAISEIDGKGYITLVQDGLDLGDCTISLSGGASWLYDLFKSIIVNEIKNGAANAFNTGIPQAIAQANTQLALQSMTLQPPDISSFVGLDYNLTEQPAVVTAGYFTVSTLGTFYPKNQNRIITPPFAPSVELPYIFNAQDAQVMISDYAINSFGWAMFTDGALNRVITASDVPSSDQKYFNTDAYRFFLNRLYSAYPDTPLEISVTPEVWPSLVVSSTEGVVLLYTLPFTWSAIQSNGTIDPCFTIDVGLSADISVSFNTTANKIQGSLATLAVNLTLASSEIGTFSVGLLSDVVNTALKSVILPKIESELEQGYPLPALPYGVQVANPVLAINDGYIAVGLDFSFSG